MHEFLSLTLPALLLVSCLVCITIAIVLSIKVDYQYLAADIRWARRVSRIYLKHYTSRISH